MDEPLSESEENEYQSEDEEDPFIVNKDVRDWTENFEEDFTIEHNNVNSEQAELKKNNHNLKEKRGDTVENKEKNNDDLKKEKSIAIKGKKKNNNMEIKECEINKNIKNESEENKTIKRRWNNEEEKVMLKFFRTMIHSKTIPRKQHCDDILQKYKNVLQGRTVGMIKSWVQHRIKKELS